MKQTKLALSLPPKFTFLFTTIFLLTFATAQNETDFDEAAAKYIVNECSRYGHYNEGSEFQTNLNALTSELTSNANATKFFNFTVNGTSNGTSVYGLFFCNNLFSSRACSNCVTTAVAEIQQRCPFSTNYIVWHGGCMVRYSHRRMFSIMDTSIYFKYNYPPAIYSQFSQSLSKTFLDLFNSVSTRNYSLSLPSDQVIVEVDKNVSLNCYADCTPDLSQANCSSCLKIALGKVPMLGTKTGTLLQPSCRLAYDFIDTRPSTSRNITKTGCKEQTLGLGIMAVLAAASFWWNTCDYLKRRKRIVKLSGLDDIETENFNFDIKAIKSATDNFSPLNELGRGGFGVVYKGTLSDGNVVAIKRLSNASRQGMREFKAEACLAAKLQHKNLVKVYGYCTEKDEMLLVYEYVLNKSLDRFLFDVGQEERLNWETRHKIIVGIARGLSYLHEDSLPKIIHRDLKSSNILLDELMNPKIADFGMAKMFGGDQSHGDTSRVAGTFGYMAPEYITAGRFSNKSDIFSYGIILLEIISGRKNIWSELNPEHENLLTYAWRLWNEGAHLQLVDSAIENDLPKSDAERLIQVGLLCIQEDPAKRPSIDSVLLMLHTQPITIPPPESPPAFLYMQQNQEVSFVIGQCLVTDTFSALVRQGKETKFLN